MSLSLSSAARGISPSATLKLNATVALLKSQGADILSLGAGEPDFDTPEHIRAAAVQALDRGMTRYTDVSGIPALRQAIADSVFERKGLRYQSNEVIVGNGAKQVIFDALEAILNPGDEVILPSPFWVSYTEMIRMAGGTPVFVQTGDEQGFLPTREQIAAAVTARTKAIIINSPNNPTGAVWTRALLQAAADIAREHDFYIISDEIYESLIYDGAEHISPASLSLDAFTRTVMVSGFSKAYAMTGWRVGYAAGPRNVIAAMAALQSHATGNANSIAQYAALAALQGPQDCVADMARVFAQRRDLLLRCLDSAGLRPGIVPRGAFYLLLDVRPFLGKCCRGAVIDSDSAFAEALLKYAHVAAVPGTPFGAAGFLRVSYAVGEQLIQSAITRIGAFAYSLDERACPCA